MTGRKEFMTTVDLDPNSLCGSWFLVLEGGNPVWQGQVVAEPQAGVYLCEIDQLDIGARNVQRLFPLQQMVKVPGMEFEWRFYDTENEVRAAYAEWASTAGERIGY